MTGSEQANLVTRLQTLIGSSSKAICESYLLLTEVLSTLTAEQRAYILGMRDPHPLR